MDAFRGLRQVLGHFCSWHGLVEVLEEFTSSDIHTCYIPGVRKTAETFSLFMANVKI